MRMRSLKIVVFTEQRATTYAPYEWRAPRALVTGRTGAHGREPVLSGARLSGTETRTQPPSVAESDTNSMRGAPAVNDRSGVSVGAACV
jgi:hypothetical protein